MGRLAVLSLASAVSIACFGCNGVDPAATDEKVEQSEDALSASPLTVDFSSCHEFAGIGFVPYANARPLVPAAYTLAGDTTNAQLVVRVASCDDINVAGHDDGDGIVSQVGIGIVSPDGTGDINNYTLWYDTTDLRLATRLTLAGVSARFAPELQFGLTDNGTGGGTLNIKSQLLPRFSVTDAVVAPPASPVPFTANWWKVGFSGRAKMDSSFPELHFGAAGNHATLTATRFTPLANIIGGTTLTFGALDSYNSFPSGHMVVTSSH